MLKSNVLCVTCVTWIMNLAVTAKFGKMMMTDDYVQIYGR